MNPIIKLKAPQPPIAPSDMTVDKHKIVRRNVGERNFLKKPVLYVSSIPENLPTLAFVLDSLNLREQARIFILDFRFHSLKLVSVGRFQMSCRNASNYN